MDTYVPSEILINATEVTPDLYARTYEFVLNSDLHIIEAVKVESMIDGVVIPVENYRTSLNHVLFELNHVRVNPCIDNTLIIEKLTKALDEIGLTVSNPPAPDSMAMCFKPLGELSDNVRFFFEGDGSVVFLAPKARLSVVAGKDTESKNAQKGR